LLLLSTDGTSRSDFAFKVIPTRRKCPEQDYPTM
jgi:hypothetical protein